MIFLDTHVLVFLATDASLLPKSLWRTLDSEVLVYSPMAKLELGFLYEINRIHEKPHTILHLLLTDYHVMEETIGWAESPEFALGLGWTRDPFDRLITAQAAITASPLLTRDRNILKHYQHAFWEKAF